jgi:hypothetical protein
MTWDLLWVGWLVLGLVVFGLLAVVLRKPTFSSRMWKWFSLRTRRRWWLARRLVFYSTALLIVGAHFCLGAPAWWSVILPAIPFTAVIVFAVFFEKESTC